MPSKPSTVVGARYGRLVAISFFDKDRHNNHRWKFICDCGREHVAFAAHVRHGKTQSCGCLSVEVGSVAAQKYLTTHGKTGTPEFKLWCSMRRRCSDTRDKRYDSYGGRGIKVCDRWQDFQNFLDDMGERPSPHHSIDRIDNDGNYEPGNCRWATDETQRRNKRTTRTVSLQGKEMPLVDACKKTKIKYSTANSRLNKLGWTDERALLTPPQT